MAEPKKQSPLNIVAGILGGIGGWSLSEYSGVFLWIPGFSLIVLLVIFSKTPLKPKAFVGAISVTTAHLVWFVAASIMMNNWSVGGLDIALLVAGVVWLWLRPGLAAMLYLGIVQSLSLIVNGVKLFQAEVGSPMHRALTVHCVFRLLAIICLIVGYINLKKQAKVGAAGSDGSMTPSN